MVDGDNYTYPAVTITGQIAELRAALVDLGRRVDDAEARLSMPMDVRTIAALPDRIAALEREIAGLRAACLRGV